jgi:hypothetical protein
MAGVKGGRNKVKPKTPTDGVPKFTNGRPLQSWAYDAYTAHVAECRAIRALADEYGVSEATVRRNIDAVHVAVLAVENSDTIDALAKHKARLQKIIRAAWQDHAAADEGQKSAYLRIAIDASEKLAAAEGVVTDRKGLDVSGNLSVTPVPLPVFAEEDPLNHFAAEAGGSHADTGDD